MIFPPRDRIIITHPPEPPPGRQTGPRVFFTADSHFGHARVIEYCKRPFSSVEEMDEKMIANWNAAVRPGDLVYHLGDFALCKADKALKIIKRLHGNKYWIFGNHDKVLMKNIEFLAQWVWARPLHQIQVGDQKITLCHYAMRTWASAHHGAWQLYGHSHGSLLDDGRSLSIDVGVDCWDFAPVAFETIREFMSTRSFTPVDHHEEA